MCMLAAAQFHGRRYEEAKATLSQVSPEHYHEKVAKDYRIDYAYIAAGVPLQYNDRGHIIPLDREKSRVLDSGNYGTGLALLFALC